MPEAQFSLHAADFAIFVLTIAVSLGIGIYHAMAARRTTATGTTTSMYLVGDQNMGIVSITLSFVVTYMSSIFVLGVPSEIFVYGITIMVFFLSLITSNSLAVWIAVPLIHSLGLTSVNEYLERRYKSVAVRRIGSILGISQNAIYMGAVLYGPAIALDSVTQFPIWASVVIVGGVAVLYTSIGGFKAVIWTDCFQMIVMLGGLIVIVTKAMTEVGITNFWYNNVMGRRIRTFSFSPNPTVRTSVWACFIGGGMYWFTLAFQQQTAQRIVSLRHLAQAKKVILTSVVGFNILAFLAALVGLSAYAYYTEKACDPFQEGVIHNANEVLPYFVMELFNEFPGFPGLFLASLFSASFSTLSSGLNSMSAVTVKDFARPIRPTMSDGQETVVAKILVLVYGFISVAICFCLLNVSGPMMQISDSFMGSVGGPFCALFILGAFFTSANWIGALSGAVSGIGLTFWISVGGTTHTTPWLPPAPSDQCFFNGSSYNMTPPVFGSYNTSHSRDDIIWTDTPYEGSGLSALYAISYFWYTTIGFVATIVVGLLVSLITGPSKAKEVDPICISHIVRRFYYDDVDCYTKSSEKASAGEKEIMMKPMMST